jgi:hypothetical protein
MGIKGTAGKFICETRGRTNFIELEASPTFIEDLPPPDTERWVIRRKASVV